MKLTVKQAERMGQVDKAQMPREDCEQVWENVKDEFGSQSSQAQAYAKGAGL